MLEKKCVTGVHLTPKEMQVTNLLLNEEEEAVEEEVEEEVEETERIHGQKKTPEKIGQLKVGRSEEMDTEEVKKDSLPGDVGGTTEVATATAPQPPEDPADKITFNPGPDIPIIAGMPDAELLDEEQATEPEAELPRRRCTDLVPYTGTRLAPLWNPGESDPTGRDGLKTKPVGSLCAPPGMMSLSAGKYVPARTPASLASLEFEAISPRILASLPHGIASSKDLPDPPAPKMSFPGNSAIVGFLEPRRCRSPAAKITVAAPPVPPGPIVEVGRLFSPVGDEGGGGDLLRPNGGLPRPHFDPCASPVSPCISPSISPFSRAAGGVLGGGAFPHLQMGGSSSSHPPSAGSSRCQDPESAAATPMENSVPGSTAELGDEAAAEGISPHQMGRKVGSFVWFEDEGVQGAGSTERVQAVGSPQQGETAVMSEIADENLEDEWEWVCPDGGWGWLVLAGSMLVNALVPGMVKSFGVLFLEFLRVFHASPLAASWIPALCYFLYSSLGPVACVLSNRFSYRTVTFLGGFLAAMGMILSYFAHSITYLYLSYGVLVGAGAGLAFPPGVFIVASYFDKRRGLANGLCVSGSALGSILLPPLLRLLLITYGYRGAVLLMGGITFHVWVGAMFYHPVEKHMKRVRRRDILSIESTRTKESKMSADDEADAVARTALLPRSEAVPIPGQRKVFWYVGKSPGDEEEVGGQGEAGGDVRRKTSTVQQQASLHRRRRRSFSPVDERPLVEVDEEEEAAFHNTIVKADYSKKAESLQEVEPSGKNQEGEALVRKEWRSGSRQRKTSRGFAESVPEEVEDEEGGYDGGKSNARSICADSAGYPSQGTAAIAGSTAMLGSTQSHLHHLSPKPSVLPRSLSAASYASSTAPPPAPMGTIHPALSASSSSFRFVSSIHHGSALAALQTEGSVSVLAASTFTLKSVGQAVGWDGGFWDRVRSNLLGSSGNTSDQRHKCKPCNCISRQGVDKPQSPKMNGIRLSGKNLPALERISNHHSLDRKQLNQVGERKISVASFISAKDVKLPSGNVEIPRKCLNCQCCTPNCTPKGESEINGLALSHDSLHAQDWSSNPEIPFKTDGYSKSVGESKYEKEKNSLLDGQFVNKEDNGNVVDLADITLKPSEKDKSTKKSRGKKCTKSSKKPTQDAPKKKLFDLSLLSDSMYLILLLSNSTSAIGYTNFIILLPAWAASLGFSSSDASLLLSVVAATDLFGRIGGAALSDLKFMPRRWYYVGGLAVSGAMLAMLPFFATGPALWDTQQGSNNELTSGLYSPSSQALVSSLPPLNDISVEPSSMQTPSLPIQESGKPTSTPSLGEDRNKQYGSTARVGHDSVVNNSFSSIRLAREVKPTSYENNIHNSEGGKNMSEQYDVHFNGHAAQDMGSRDENYENEEAEETHISSSAYLQLAAACAVFGLASGAYVGVTAALFSDMLGPDRLASSFGLSLLANGILQLAGPPLCGLALSRVPSDSSVQPTISPEASGSNAHSIRNAADVMSTPEASAYAPIISTLGLCLVAGAGMWGLMPGIERKRREKEGGVMI